MKFGRAAAMRWIFFMGKIGGLSEAPIGDAGGDEGALDHRFHIDEDTAGRQGSERRRKAVFAEAAMRHGENQSVELAERRHLAQLEPILALGLGWIRQRVVHK